MKDEKKITDMTTEERFGVKGLNQFIIQADDTARAEFKEICKKLGAPHSLETEHVYAAGYLSCLKNLTLTLNKQ